MKQKSVIVWLVILVVAAAGGFYVYVHNQSKTMANNTLSGCRAETVGPGDIGNCVKDAQTMTDYMETAELTECPFNGGRVLPITGTYDTATEKQIKIIQNWANCYYQQEGMNESVSATGTVDNNTWTELCDYAYDSPKQSDANVSPYTKASLAAGKDASC